MMPTHIPANKKPFQSQHAPSHFPWRLLFLSLFSAFLAFILIIGGMRTWAWMQKPTSFPIKQVKVQGELTHISPETIEKIVHAQLTGGFFSLHVSAAKQAILDCPWIADVSFRRVWPDTLVVRVHEQEPIARFGAKGLLSATGVIFYPDIHTIPQTLPDLEGAPDQALLLLNFYHTANILVKLLGLTITALQVDAAGNWTMQMSNQVVVILGRQAMLPRLKRFVLIYPKITALSNPLMVLVDLRYQNGIAVQYKT